MSKKLFVGGLSWGTTDDRLKEAFSAIGEVVDAKVVTDRETGRSRGFGFVTYADASAADEAVSRLDGTDLDGRSIRVNEAQPQTRPRPGGGGPPRDGGGPREPGGAPPREFRGGGGGDRYGKDAGRRGRDYDREEGGRRSRGDRRNRD